MVKLKIYLGQHRFDYASNPLTCKTLHYIVMWISYSYHLLTHSNTSPYDNYFSQEFSNLYVLLITLASFYSFGFAMFIWFHPFYFANMIPKLQHSTVDQQVSISAEPNFASTVKGVVAQSKIISYKSCGELSVQCIASLFSPA